MKGPEDSGQQVHLEEPAQQGQVRVRSGMPGQKIRRDHQVPDFFRFVFLIVSYIVFVVFT